MAKKDTAKKKQQKAPSTPMKLRVALSIVLSLCALSIVAVFYFGQSIIKDKASSTSQTSANADASDDNLLKLQQLKRDLEGKQEIATKAQEITLSNTNYRKGMLDDLTLFAKRSGVSIAQFSFNSSSEAATPSASGLTMQFVTITVQSPVDYENFLSFIQMIEQNIHKMQINRIAISTNQSGPNFVNVEPLVIGAYIR